MILSVDRENEINIRTIYENQEHYHKKYETRKQQNRKEN